MRDKTTPAEPALDGRVFQQPTGYDHTPTEQLPALSDQRAGHLPAFAAPGDRPLGDPGRHDADGTPAAGKTTDDATPGYRDADTRDSHVTDGDGSTTDTGTDSKDSDYRDTDGHRTDTPADETVDTASDHATTDHTVTDHTVTDDTVGKDTVGKDTVGKDIVGDDTSTKDKSHVDTDRADTDTVGADGKSTVDTTADHATGVAESGVPAQRAPGETGGAKADEDAGTILFGDDVVTRFRGRWRELQSDFVDDPKQAVRGADELVDEVMRTLSETLAQHKRTLEGQWQSGPGDTEELRLALRKYRSFFDQLLNS
jgi:hypothetical protein